MNRLHAFLILVPLLAGCNNIKKLIGHDHSDPPQAVNPSYTRLLEVIEEDTNITAIDNFSNVDVLGAWINKTLNLDDAGRRKFWARMQGQELPHYFSIFMHFGEDNRVNIPCSQNALAFEETLQQYGISAGSRHVLGTNGGGIHQFTEYVLHGARVMEDVYYGVYYVDPSSGRRLNYADMMSKKASFNGDMVAYDVWVQSTVVQYNVQAVYNMWQITWPWSGAVII